MKKIILMILTTMLLCSCASTIGYVETIYDDGVVLNVGGDSKFYKINKNKDKVAKTDLVIVKRKKIMLYE